MTKEADKKKSIEMPKPTCGTCTHFDGVICDQFGLLRFEDDDPDERCIPGMFDRYMKE